ncbi:prefoldin subunit alpha [Candidatus Pacearchaeota archaeon CG06_land_8_20_14_3_00_35_12]|nr:MAG: prefoldin subunit alpha [Candidatus Pacearchaeota archaeon CG06_land_8_20_14_3_00_35_12]
MEQENRQNKIMEFSLLENQLKQIEQQIILLDQQISKQQNLMQTLDEFKKTGENSEIFLPFSDELFVKAKLLDNKNLLINVGGNTFVKKDIDGVKKTIQKQIDKLMSVRKELSLEIDKILQGMLRIEKEIKG